MKELQLNFSQPVAILGKLAVATLLVACSHFEGPKYSSKHQYSGPGEFSSPYTNGTENQNASHSSNDGHSEEGFSSPEELYQSDEILKTEPPQEHIKSFSLQWPVDLISVSRGFTVHRKKNHMGLDLGGRKNTPIKAAHDGIVIYAGSGFRGFGKMIIIEFNNTWATLYGHLNSFKVKSGAHVKAGDTIGYMGRTGRATGVHLHFELMKNKVPIDPMELLTLEDRGLATNSQEAIE